MASDQRQLARAAIELDEADLLVADDQAVLAAYRDHFGIDLNNVSEPAAPMTLEAEMKLDTCTGRLFSSFALPSVRTGAPPPRPAPPPSRPPPRRWNPRCRRTRT
jgi:hypothetical protein